MTLEMILEKKNMTKYQLSKESGVPKSTILDICSGKSSIERCSAKTIQQIAAALGCTMETIMSLSPSGNYDSKTGKPVDKSYLECGLPEYLQESLNKMKECNSKLKRGEDYLHWDCDFMELQSDINCAEVDGNISAEQAWYLREKYLGIKKPGGSL